MTYFNSDIDRLYIGVGNFHPETWDPASVFFQAIARSDRDAIEYLAIDSKINWFLKDDEEPHQVDFFDLWRLRTIVEVLPGEENIDITFCNSPTQVGELHGWSMSPKSQAMPWFLREGEDEDVALWEAVLSAEWADLETNMDCMENHLLLEANRLVSQTRLLQDPRWRNRMLQLAGMVLYNNCLYAKDGIIDTILDWRDNAPNKYLELSFLLSRRHPNFARTTFMADPEDMYTSRVACSCPIGHKHIEPLYFPTRGEFEIPRLDFGAAISRFEPLWAFEKDEVQTTT